MKSRITSKIRFVLFTLVFIVFPFTLVPYAGTVAGYLGNAAETQACPIKVEVDPTSRTIDAGGSTTFQVTVKFLDYVDPRYKGPVTLSVTNLPSGVSASFSRNPVSDDDGNRTETSTLSITSTGNVKPGRYTIKITGTAIWGGGPDPTSVYATLIVNSPPAPCFSVDAHEKKKVDACDNTFFTVVAKWCNGYDDDVTLSVDGNSLPAGVTYKFDKNPLSPTGNADEGNAQTKLRIYTSCDTPPGVYTIIVKGTSGGVTKSDTATLTVNAPAEKFSLSSGPQTPSDIKPGETAKFKIYAHNFFDRVRFSVETPLPAGIKDATIDPMVLEVGGHDWVILTIDTGATIKEGTYRITVKGVCGDQTDEEVVTLSVGKPVVTETGNLSVDKSVFPTAAKVGGLVLYTVRISNTGRGTITGLVVRDSLPVGVGYVKGSAVVDGKKIADPSGTRTLLWNLGNLAGGETITLKYQGVVKPSISRGRSTNTVVVTGTDPTGRHLTARDTADIGVPGDTFERKGKIKGSVFVDENRNGLKNVDEEGVPGIWIILETGERTSTDEEGIFTFEEVESGQHLVGLDERKLGKEYYVIGDASRIVSIFSGGTGRTGFALGLTGPSKKELEAMKKAEEEKKKQEEEALKKEEEKKLKEEAEKKKRQPTGTISGRVFIDVDGDRLYDAAEKGVEKIVVLLDGTKRAVTDARGNYHFDRVPFGKHTVTILEDKAFLESYSLADQKRKTVEVAAALVYKADIPIAAKKGLRVELELRAQ